LAPRPPPVSTFGVAVRYSRRRAGTAASLCRNRACRPAQPALRCASSTTSSCAVAAAARSPCPTTLADRWVTRIRLRSPGPAGRHHRPAPRTGESLTNRGQRLPLIPTQRRQPKHLTPAAHGWLSTPASAIAQQLRDYRLYGVTVSVGSVVVC